MAADEFAVFRAVFVHDWAADLAKIDDLTSDEALAQAEARTDADLPFGAATPGHHLFVILANEEPVGSLWFSIDPRGHAFLDDVTIREEHRGKSYGRRALELCELEVRQRGVKRIELHVYRHNPRAIALYESLGYRTTGIKMKKVIAL